MSLYLMARESGVRAAGFYNDNVRAETDGGPVIVRIPIHGADGMDLRMWPEQDVIAAVTPWVAAVPQVLHVCQEPAFQIHRFVTGSLVDDISPRGVAVPEHLPGDVVRFFRDMARVPVGAFPETSVKWPKDGDTPSFGARLSAVTREVWRRFREPYAELYAALGVPEDPMRRVEADWHTLTARPFGALHCDVHRKNLIVSEGRTWFLDWELALWGDPLYDMAVHLHKMDYLPAEADAVTSGWLGAMSDDVTSGSVADLTVYVRHEQVKSALVDTVRYSKLILAEADEVTRSRLVGSLTTKVNRAREVWSSGRPLERGEVRRVLSNLTPVVS